VSKPLLAALVAVQLAMAPGFSHADTPLSSSEPIRLIVGASPGGTTDLLARMLAENMAAKLKQNIVVENKPGAGGNIAAQEVARSKPDGHTLLVAFTSHTMNAAMYKHLPYDPIADFSPISLMAKVTSVLVARPDYSAANLSEVLKTAKARGEPLKFAIGGLGSSLQMDTYDFASSTGIEVVQVPYKGSSPATADVMGRHVEFMFAPLGGAQPLLSTGKLRAYAVTGSRRLEQLADVPVITDTIPDFHTNYGWFGLLGPAHMAPQTVATLNQAANEALQSAKIKERLAIEGSTPEQVTPEAFGRFLKTDIEQWKHQVEKFQIEQQ